MVKQMKELIEVQESFQATCRRDTNVSIPRRNDIIDRAEKIYKTINTFSMYAVIAFVDFNTGETLICKEIGEITLFDLMGIAEQYTLGKMIPHSIETAKNCESYISAYCRKLTE